MSFTRFTRRTLCASALSCLIPFATALADPIAAASGNQAQTEFDIVKAGVTATEDMVTFTIGVSGKAGTTIPAVSGKLAGARVYSYVWPTSLDSSTVGFEKAQGILALAVTAHPDFDDTPATDENGDGDKANDGNLWHSHWVVLGPDDACGKGSLKVIDIPEGAKPRLPATWPGLPLLIDSPNLVPEISDSTVQVKLPAALLGDIFSFKFDGVTAGLRVNESTHAPLLCVTDVFDVASGDLSLPGTTSK